MHLRRMAMCMLPFLLAAVLQVSSQQAYPPGVPPRQDNYQQPPPPQQQQQYQPPPQQQQQYQQQQYQQQPPQQQQYQQQPPQQQQQQQYQQQQYQQQPQYQHQQQQPNVQQFHQNANPAGHHGGFKADMHNAEHIMEHLQEVIDAKPKEQMTEEELEFHYFKLHDFDNNNKLDGVEIGKAISHYHGDEPDTKSPDAPPPKTFSDEEIASIVDNVLKEHDVNKDGYVEYSEFKATQVREEPAKS